jgi:hypothetical protein
MMNMRKKYKLLKNTWFLDNKKQENFFVSYAVRGPTIPQSGMQEGLPVNHPINGPVSEPSPLNTRCMYSAPGWNPSC